jgi:coenzyme PQQ precursor peptide PqqA
MLETLFGGCHQIIPVLRPTIDDRQSNGIAPAAIFGVALPSFTAAIVPLTWESLMAWKTPKIVEVQVGMEINMYACAARK